MTEARRALVTGGAGFIGSHLVDRLLADEWDVMVVDDLSTGHRENVNAGAEFEELDVTSSGLDSLFESWRPARVFHLAAQVNLRRSVEDPAFDTRVNALGTLRVLEASRRQAAEQVVFVSTGGAIYGEPAYRPCDEKHPCAPLSIYGANKRVAEHYLEVYRHSYGLRTTALRFANIYGPRQDPHGEAGVVAIFSELMLRDRQPAIFGDGGKTRDYVYVADAVSAVVLAAEGEAKSEGGSRVYNVGRGEEISDQEVFDTVAAACGYAGEPRYEEVRPGEVIRIALDSGLIESELGWRAGVGFVEGVELTVPFYRRKLGLD